MAEQHKKDMGKMGEAIVIQQILENNCEVFIDFGDNSKIDLICRDRNKKLHTIQVKTVGRSPKNLDATSLQLYKSGPNYRFSYTSLDFDWFAVVDNTTKKIAWVPSTICDTNGYLITLRHLLPKRKNQHGYEMFDDYTKFPFN